MDRPEKSVFDPAATFDFESQAVAIEYGVHLIDNHEEIGHWSDLIPSIPIPGQ